LRIVVGSLKSKCLDDILVGLEALCGAGLGTLGEIKYFGTNSFKISRPSSEPVQILIHNSKSRSRYRSFRVVFSAMVGTATKGAVASGSKATKNITYPPNQTYVGPIPSFQLLSNSHRLYIRDIPSNRIQKADLRISLYALFSTYGPVLDVVALKTTKMRGQAHVVFRDVQTATQAMRALQGFEFFGIKMVSLFMAYKLPVCNLC